MTTADGQVVVLLEVVGVSVDTHDPGVEILVEIIKVVLAKAARAVTSAGSIVKGHSTAPSVILTNGNKEVTTIGFNTAGKEPSTSANVEIGVLAVAAGSTAALVPGNLHQSLFTTTTGNPRPARTLLESKGRNHNGRDTSLTSILLEQRDKLPASLVRAVRHGKCLREGLIADVAQVEVGRVPSTGMDTAIHPVDVTIRTRFAVGLSSCTRITARTLEVDGTTVATSTVVVVVIAVAVTVVVTAVVVGEGVGLLSLLWRPGSSDPGSSRAGSSGGTSGGRSNAGRGTLEAAFTGLLLQGGSLSTGQRDVAMGQGDAIMDGASVGSYDGHKKA